MSGFALCVYAYAGPDSTHLDCVQGEIVYVHRVEPSGWAGVVDSEEGRWGWVPWAFVQQIDEDAVAVLWPIAPELRLGAYRAMTAIHAHATDAGYSSPDSNESDALGDEWAVAPPAAPVPKHRRPSRITRDLPIARPSLDNSEPPTPRPPSPPDQQSPERTTHGVQFALPRGASRSRGPPPPSSGPSSSFVPPRVRAFRLRSKSHDRGVRSDSESTTRPRRPSVSLRRTRMSMFGPARELEPHPSEEIARLAARPWYLQPKHTPATGDIVIDPDGSVRAGTLEAIAERLTCDPPSRSYEYAFRRAVLLTYEAFTTSQQLFDLLTDQYALEPPRQLTEDQFTEWKDAKLRPTQARVLDVLGMWLGLPRLYTDDPEIVLRIREFLQFVNEPDGLAAEAKTHLRAIDKLINPPPALPRPTTSPRRKTLKHRPFPPPPPSSSSHTASPSSLLLTPRQSPRHATTGPPPGLVETAFMSTSPRLDVPFADGEGERRSIRSQRDTMSVSSRETATGSTSSHRTGSSSQNTSISSASTQQQQQQQQRVSHPVPSGISNVDPTALAHHLTLLEASLYMRVRRRQCLEWHHAGKMLAQQDKRGSLGSGTVRSVDTVGSGTGTMRSGNETGTARSGNGTAKSGVDAATSVAGSAVDVSDLREFCATNDRLAGWVKWTVLSLKNATLRAEAIGTWVRVAEKCRQLDNTSSLCAIVAGLTSSDITRLNVTASLVPTNRSQRLTDLQRITSPAGSFAALKVVYAGADGPGVPFVGMYLTGLVHASDQFKDTVPGVVGESGSNRPRGSLEGDEPATPTQVPLTPTQTGSTLTQAVSPRPAQTPPTPTQAASTPTQIPLTPTQTASGPPRMLLNFTKRHKQADIINAMLKFQQWPYTIVPTATEPPAPRHPSSSPPNTITSTSTPTSPCTYSLYPYTPSTSAPTALYASAVGVAWVEEQLGRAARITLGSDWTYERSMRLFEDEAGWASVKDMMNEVGF